MHLECCSTFGKRKNTLALRFPKLSQHPAYMDHAILHGKLFSNPLIVIVLQAPYYGMYKFTLQGTVNADLVVWYDKNILIKSSIRRKKDSSYSWSFYPR